MASKKNTSKTKTIKTESKSENKIVFRKRKMKVRIICFCVLVLIVGLSFIFKPQLENWINFKYNGEQASSQIDAEGLRIHFIDVGQADCVAVEFPNNQHMLIDAGDNDEESREKMISYINSNVFTSGEAKIFDYFIVTHYHADHIGGAVEIFENYEIRECYFPSVEDLEIANGTADYSKTSLMEKVEDAQSTEGSSFTLNETEAGKELNIGAVKLKMYSPFYNETTIENKNNESPIIVLSYGGKRIMLTGDAEKELEREVVDDASLNGYSSELDIDLLKLGHHGGKNSTCQELLDVATPQYVVISVGEGNSYGHPNQETIERVKESGVNESSIYRTDQNGSVCASITDDGKIAIAADMSQWSPVFISWYYICGGVLLIGAIVLFLPKANAKKALKELKTKKK